MSWWIWRLHQVLILSAGGGRLHAGSGSLHPGRASLLSSGCPPHPWSWFLQDSSLWRHSHQPDSVAASRRSQREGHLLLKGTDHTADVFNHLCGLTLFSKGRGRAASFSGSVHLLCHQRCHRYRPARVRSEGSLPAG